MNASSLFSLGSITAEKLFGQAEGVKLAEAGLGLRGLSLTDGAMKQDFASLLKSVISLKIKAKDDSGAGLEKLMLEVSESDTEAKSAEELLYLVLSAFLSKLDSSGQLLSEEVNVATDESNDAAGTVVLKDKVIQLLEELKGSSELIQLLFDKLGQAKADGTPVKLSGVSWQELLSELVSLQLKQKPEIANNLPQVQEQPEADAVAVEGNNAPVEKPETAGLTYEKLLTLAQNLSRSVKLTDLDTSAKAYGLRQEGVLSKSETDTVSTKDKPVDIESRYLQLPKSDNLIKEIGLKFNLAENNLDNEGGANIFTAGSALSAEKTEALANNAAKFLEEADALNQMLNQKEVVDQFVQRIHTSLRDRVQEAFIELKPEHLGRAFLKVTLEDGKVSVRIQVSNLAVKETLESNFSMLKDSLRDRGFTTDRFSVSVGVDARAGSEHPKGQFVAPDTANALWFEEVENDAEKALVSDNLGETQPNYYLETALVNYLI